MDLHFKQITQTMLHLIMLTKKLITFKSIKYNNFMIGNLIK